MRATAIRAQSFAEKSSHMSMNRARAKRANAVNVRSFAKKRRHTLQGLALLGASAVGGDSFGILPIRFPGRTIQAAI